MTLEIAERLLHLRGPLIPRRATFTRARGFAAAVAPAADVDEVIATYFPAPRSYTGEDLVEISAHGSPVILHAIVRGAIGAGARLARPGEFTLRAFLNGKCDLVQAEAVADLVDAVTPLQARLAFDQLQGTLTDQIGAIDASLFDLIARLEASLDFPDEGYHFVNPGSTREAVGSAVRGVEALLADAVRGRMIREGATVVIAGRTNVGKSSVFNKLTGVERAIVTDIPGTTRDMVTEQIDVDGLAITLVDTAGWRDTKDVVEREGVSRGQRARAAADLTLVVWDGSTPIATEDEAHLAATRDTRRILVMNKCDLPTVQVAIPANEFSVQVSARTGEGFDHLRAAIVKTLTTKETVQDTAAISNARHVVLLEQACVHLRAAEHAAADGAPEEFVLTDLHDARAALEEVTGKRTSEDLLRHIFSRFCIGK
jgi:tRNA modification GTPase